MSCETCGTNCSASCDDVRQIIEQVIYAMLQAGRLQAGLLSCENGRLTQDSAVVLCSTLTGLVQDGIDEGTITIPHAVSITSAGTVLTVHYSDGRSLDFETRPILDTIPIVTATAYDADGHITITLSDGTVVRSENSLRPLLAGVFKSCDGGDIAPGATLPTCENMHTELETLELEIKRFIEEEFLLTLSKVRLPVLTDMETMQGNGLPSDKIRINKIWLTNYIKSTVYFVDCEGNAIDPGRAIVTCVLFNEYIEDAADALAAQRIQSVTYADGSITVTLVDGSSFTADISSVDKHIESGSLSGRTLTLTRNDGVTFDVDLSTFAVLTSGTVVTGDGTADNPIKFNLSQGAGNLLQVRDDGLYYGIEAPADISNLYVDSLLGDDSNPGTYAAPFKTFVRAVASLTGVNNQTIYLKCGDDRPEYLQSGSRYIMQGTVRVTAYGDPILDKPVADGCLSNPQIRAGIQRPRLRVVGYDLPAYEKCGVPSFQVANGAKLVLECIQVMRNIKRSHPTWGFWNVGLAQTQSYGALFLNGCVFQDEAAEANRESVVIGEASVGVGRVNVELGWCTLNELPDSTFRLFSAVKTMFSIGQVQNAECTGTTDMLNNCITKIQANPDNYMGGIIRAPGNAFVIVPQNDLGL